MVEGLSILKKRVDTATKGAPETLIGGGTEHGRRRTHHQAWRSLLKLELNYQYLIRRFLLNEEGFKESKRNTLLREAGDGDSIEVAIRAFLGFGERKLERERRELSL